MLAIRDFRGRVQKMDLQSTKKLSHPQFSSTRLTDLCYHRSVDKVFLCIDMAAGEMVDVTKSLMKSVKPQQYDTYFKLWCYSARFMSAIQAYLSSWVIIPNEHWFQLT